jgi:predicted aconitase with swiveling domain
MDKIIIKGRGTIGGSAEGEALVSHDAISGWGGINCLTGEVTELHHELYKKSFSGKVLVFPGAKGSSGWSIHFHFCRLLGTAPLAVVYNITTAKMAAGAVVMKVPAVTDLEQDPLEIIETGDWVKVDGDNGIIEVTKKK